MTGLQLPNYEIRRGLLADVYGLFDPLTINTGAQISADRITDPSLRQEMFYTANVPLATKRKGKLLLGIGGRTAFNVVFGTNTGEVCQELRDTGYIHLTPEQREFLLRLEKSGEVTFVDPQDLQLSSMQDDSYRQFVIRTGEYQKDVTVARMPFVRAGYGSGDMLRQVMDNLRVNGSVVETMVYVISPDHAAENVGDDEMIGRASWLSYFNLNSNFIANLRYFDNNCALRGVPSDVAAGAQKSAAVPLEARLPRG